MEKRGSHSTKYRVVSRLERSRGPRTAGLRFCHVAAQGRQAVHAVASVSNTTGVKCHSRSPSTGVIAATALASQMIHYVGSLRDRCPSQVLHLTSLDNSGRRRFIPVSPSSSPVRVQLDEWLPRGRTRELVGHDVRTAPEMGWASKRNGELLALAADEFDVFLTSDRNLSYQQDVSVFDIAIISWWRGVTASRTCAQLHLRFCRFLVLRNPVGSRSSADDAVARRLGRQWLCEILRAYVDYYVSRLSGPMADDAWHSLVEAGPTALPEVVRAFGAAGAPSVKAYLVQIIPSIDHRNAFPFLRNCCGILTETSGDERWMVS